MKEGWMKNDGGWWRMKDEGWLMKDDDFKLLRGFADRQTDETDSCDCRVTFVISALLFTTLNPEILKIWIYDWQYEFDQTVVLLSPQSQSQIYDMMLELFQKKQVKQKGNIHQRDI